MRFQPQQRVTDSRREHRALDLMARQQNEILDALGRRRAHPDLRFARMDHVDDLGRGAAQELQVDVGEALAELHDRGSSQ